MDTIRVAGSQVRTVLSEAWVPEPQLLEGNAIDRRDLVTGISRVNNVPLRTLLVD